MWQAVDLAKRSEGKALTSLSEGQQADLRLVQIDQEPLKDEVLPYIGQLERITAENTGWSDRDAAERGVAAGKGGRVAGVSGLGQ